MAVAGIVPVNGAKRAVDVADMRFIKVRGFRGKFDVGVQGHDKSSKLERAGSRCGNAAMKLGGSRRAAAAIGR